jgi:alcohol dehydrogenase
MCTEIVRPGGHVANVGVHGKAVQLNIQDLWIANISISMGLVNTTTLGMLLKLVAQDKLPVGAFVTHHFALDDVVEAYDVFGDAANSKALKVVLNR